MVKCMYYYVKGLGSSPHSPPERRTGGGLCIMSDKTGLQAGVCFVSLSLSPPPSLRPCQYNEDKKNFFQRGGMAACREQWIPSVGTQPQ